MLDGNEIDEVAVLREERSVRTATIARSAFATTIAAEAPPNAVSGPTDIGSSSEVKGKLELDPGSRKWSAFGLAPAKRAPLLTSPTYARFRGRSACSVNDSCLVPGSRCAMPQAAWRTTAPA